MKKIRKGLKAAIVLMLAVIMILAVTGCAAAAGKKSSQDKTAGSRTIAEQESTADRQTGTSEKQTDNADKQSKVKEKSDTEDKQNNASKDLKDTADKKSDTSKEQEISEDEEYYSKEDVALYIHLYEHLPDNYITKNEAKDLGWVSSRGNLWDVAPGKCIGGDSFGNREGLLPEKKGRKYYECDVDYEGGYRGEDRLIYSSDGLVYYTGDHYNSFELLYGEE